MTMTMTDAQTTALESPCYLACETMKPVFRRRAGPTTVVLTVNTGYE